MSRRIGIVVREATICAVALERGHVEATAVRPLEEPADVGEHMASLFEALGGLTRRASVRIALDRPVAQLKTVPDAPQVGDRKLIELAIRENADRYFIGGQGARYFGVRSVGGTTSIIGCDRRAIDELARAAFSAGATELIVMSVASIPAPRNDAAVEPRDPQAVASADERTIPVIRLSASNTRRRVTTAAVSGASIIVMALLATPLVRLRRDMEATHRELAALRAQSDAAAKERDSRTALRTMIQRVRPAGVVMTDLLADITNALPAHAALLALTVDSTKGSAVILASDALEAVPSLDSVRVIEQVKLSGPVTRERIGDRDLERATILFTVRAP